MMPLARGRVYETSHKLEDLSGRVIQIRLEALLTPNGNGSPKIICRTANDDYGLQPPPLNLNALFVDSLNTA